MKRIAALFLVLISVLALSACAKTTGELANAQRRMEEFSAGTRNDSDTTVSTSGTQGMNTESQQVTEGTSASEETSLISRERAVEIALENAGLAKDGVFDLDAELDKERRGTFWEVDFETREFEYSYEINAETGKVVHQEKERQD